MNSRDVLVVSVNGDAGQVKVAGSAADTKVEIVESRDERLYSLIAFTLNLYDVRAVSPVVVYANEVPA